ncbi:MAG: four helix bundle protein [Candidatus Doudnabacteria bacterium]|nr:four helix bundle protein [Candidatus Doudnabacteria bacterium]
MNIKRFEDIVAWQKAQELCTLLYKNLRECKDYSFKDQLLRAVLSISNNIAEGFDRGSEKELRQFLYIAKGSAAEVRSMLYLAGNLGYLPPQTIEQAFTLTDETSRILAVFIQRINAGLVSRRG